MGGSFFVLQVKEASVRNASAEGRCWVRRRRFVKSGQDTGESQNVLELDLLSPKNGTGLKESMERVQISNVILNTVQFGEPIRQDAFEGHRARKARRFLVNPWLESA